MHALPEALEASRRVTKAERRKLVRLQLLLGVR